MRCLRVNTCCPTRRSSDLGEACEYDSPIRWCGETGIAFVCKQSQRDCVLQPKVARNELPWVMVQHGINRNARSEEHTSELQSHHDLVCRLLLEKKQILTQA